MKTIMKYLAYCFYMAFFYLLLMYCRPVFLSFIIETFSKIKYNDDFIDSPQAANYMVLLAYVVVSFFWNRKMLKTIGKRTTLMWIVNCVLDFFFIPLSMLIMVLYNNTTWATMANLSSVENMFLMWLLMAVKHIVISLIYGNIIIDRKQGKAQTSQYP